MPNHLDKLSRSKFIYFLKIIFNADKIGFGGTNKTKKNLSNPTNGYGEIKVFEFQKARIWGKSERRIYIDESRSTELIVKHPILA